MLSISRRRILQRLPPPTRRLTTPSPSAASAPPPPPPPPPSGDSPPRRSLKPLLTLSLTGLATLGAYTLGSIYPPPPLTLLFPPPAPPPPTDPLSPSSLAYTASLERQLLSLPLLESLRSQPGAQHEFYEARPYAQFPEERRGNHLTAGILRGPGKLAVPPVVWCRRDETESWVFVHVGRGLCGHDGIVHGGLLATLLDESMARTAINNLPERIGVTATLNITYRAPTKADQFIVIHTKLDSVKGRKANVSARVEDMHGTLLVEATSMFVQPRYAKLLNRAAVAQVLGEPPALPPSEEPVHLADGERLGDLSKEG